MELGQLTIMRSMSLVSAPFWHARGTGWPGRGHGLSGCKLLARPCWRSKHAARCICRRLLRMAVTRSGCCTSLLYGVALVGRNAVNLLLTYHTTCNGHFLERSGPSLSILQGPGRPTPSSVRRQSDTRPPCSVAPLICCDRPRTSTGVPARLPGLSLSWSLSPRPELPARRLRHAVAARRRSTTAARPRRS